MRHNIFAYSVDQVFFGGGGIFYQQQGLVFKPRISNADF